MIAVMGSKRINLPIRPPIAINGTIAKIVVNCPDKAGMAKVLTVFRAAWLKVSFSVNNASCIPSIIKMNTSTSNPKDRIMPTCTILFRVLPSNQTIARAAKKVKGIDKPAIIASRQVRATNKIKNTHKTPCQPFWNNWLRSDKIVSLSVAMTWYSMP